MFYEAARSANWFARSPRSASTPADRSKRATQHIPRAALPALCLLSSGRLGDPVHGMGCLVYGTWQKYDAVHGMRGLVYGDKDYDENGQEKGTYFGRLKRIDAVPKKRVLILGLFGVRD